VFSGTFGTVNTVLQHAHVLHAHENEVNAKEDRECYALTYPKIQEDVLGHHCELQNTTDWIVGLILLH
jgi:hypothetical protein